MLRFLGVLGSVIVLKLLSSADDLIWLSRLTAGLQGMRLKAAQAVYLLALLVACLAALILAQFGAFAASALTGSEAWFSLLGSVLLIVFAVTALRDEDEEGVGETERLRDVFAVSLIGSIDEVAVFTVALSTGEIPALPLFLGTTIAGVITLGVVRGIREIDSLTRRLDRVPVWVLIALIGAAGIVISVQELAR